VWLIKGGIYNIPIGPTFKISSDSSPNIAMTQHYLQKSKLKPKAKPIVQTPLGLIPILPDGDLMSFPGTTSSAS
jgi:hypothetical protein